MPFALKAPADVHEATIAGVTYRAEDGLIYVVDEAHIPILKRHGYTDPNAPPPVAVQPDPDAPAAQDAPAIYTGPYRAALAFARAAGHDVGDDCGDAALLRLVDEILSTRDAGSRKAAEPVGKAAPRAAKVPRVVKEAIKPVEDLTVPPIDAQRDVSREGGLDDFKETTMPDFDAMRQPQIIDWITESGATIPRYTAKQEAAEIAKARWLELHG